MHCPKCGEALGQKDETNVGIHCCAGCAGLHELASFLSSYEAAKSRARRKRKDKK